jgi:hypothetical protein
MPRAKEPQGGDDQERRAVSSEAARKFPGRNQPVGVRARTCLNYPSFGCDSWTAGRKAASARHISGDFHNTSNIHAVSSGRTTLLRKRRHMGVLLRSMG